MSERRPSKHARPAHTPPGSAAWRIRSAVRAWRRDTAALDPTVDLGPDAAVCVGVSGGADSLALTAAAVAEFSQVHALIVDHGLQQGSAEVARKAADIAASLGAQPRVMTADVGSAGGPEAAAREARYAALGGARGDMPVLLAHTMSDQAETVLLGLARGSGARSLRAMAAWDAPWGRPLLSVPREDTRAACAEAGLEVWDDPHNVDPRFRRVRVRRELLPLAEDVLGPGVAESLARTAAHLRADDDALSALAAAALADGRLPADAGAGAGAEAGDGAGTEVRDGAGGDGGVGAGLDVGVVEDAAPAIGTRVVKAWLEECGAVDLTSAHIDAVTALCTNWSGQGPVAVPAGPGWREVRRHKDIGAEAVGGRSVARLSVWREGRALRIGLRQ